MFACIASDHHTCTGFTSLDPGWAIVNSSEKAPASRRAASSNLSPSDSVSSSAASIRTSFENSPMFEELRWDQIKNHLKTCYQWPSWVFVLKIRLTDFCTCGSSRLTLSVRLIRPQCSPSHQDQRRSRSPSVQWQRSLLTVVNPPSALTCPLCSPSTLEMPKLPRGQDITITTTNILWICLHRKPIS